MKKPVVLVVMDGIGCSEKEHGNAVMAAATPNLDRLMAECPWTKIKAHGVAVGLPSDDDMGNSEVGHNALGCGQVYSQGAALVNESIASGKMYESAVWKKLADNCAANGSKLHFIGLLSDGNVHSNIEHLKSMAAAAKKAGVKTVRAHVLLDGRDVPAQSATEYVSDLESCFAALNDENFDARIASGGGRMKITMDRYMADWAMVKRGWDTHVLGKGAQWASATDAIMAARAEKADIIDQDLPPFVIAENGAPVGKIEDNDSVVLFNFRGDRAIEISMAFDMGDDFTGFDREITPKVVYAGMLQYDGDLHLPANYLVAPPDIQNTLSELLVKNNIKQYAVSETQKFGHVTYFWNGNRSEKTSEALEIFDEVPSDRVSFDERPWMKAAEVTDLLIAAMAKGEYGFIRANYPNGDMVGHTGSMVAATIAVETVDLCLARVLAAAEAYGYAVLITADHGNADEMLEKSKSGAVSPKTAHTLNPVPFIVVDRDAQYAVKDGDFGLANVAATVAQMLGIEKPAMWEESILK